MSQVDQDKGNRAIEEEHWEEPTMNPRKIMRFQDWMVVMSYLSIAGFVFYEPSPIIGAIGWGFAAFAIYFNRAMDQLCKSQYGLYRMSRRQYDELLAEAKRFSGFDRSGD